MKLNLGCGNVFVDDGTWLNIDFHSGSRGVRAVNLLKGLPVASESFSVVYSSHFFEHIPRALVPDFLNECFRVLRPGGVLRLVLPDLQEMTRTYLQLRDSKDDMKADFLVLQIVDQCVRKDTGGELAGFYQALRRSDDKAMIEFVYERNGSDVYSNRTPQGSRTRAPNALSVIRSFQRFMSWFTGSYLQAALALVPRSFRTLNVSMASVGELHHWVWDFRQLQVSLEQHGFANVSRHSAVSSSIEGFPFFPLDLDASGRARKGAESMYVEAVRVPISASD